MKKLQHKLVLIFMVVGLLPMLVIGFLSYRSSQENIREEVLKANDLFLEQVRGNIQDFFAERERDALFISRTADVNNTLDYLRLAGYDLESSMWRSRRSVLENFAKSVLEDFGYLSFFTTDPEGMIVYSTNEEEIGTELREENYVKEALEGSVGWSDFFYLEEEGKNAMIVTAPVGEDRRLGVVGIAFPRAVLDEMIHGGVASLGESSDAFLIDQEGLLLSNTRQEPFDRGAALREFLESEEVKVLSGPISGGQVDFIHQAEYEDFLGNPVLGSKGVLQLGGSPAGVVIKVDQEEIYHQTQVLWRAIVLIMIVGALVILGSSYFFSNSITKPVLHISDYMQKAEKGDLTIKPRIKSRDEIGQMGQSFSQMLEGLRESMKKVQKASTEIDLSSENIASTSGQLYSDSKDQNKSIQDLLASIEEMNLSINETSKNVQEAANYSEGVVTSAQEMDSSFKIVEENIKRVTGEVSGVANSIAEMEKAIEESVAVTKNTEKQMEEAYKLTREGQEKVEQVVRGIEELKKAVQQLGGVVNSLGDSAGKIGEIIEVIDDIAEQTNLLALNASIEAARAGENGKGFAVVAGAIGDLAHRSQEATKDIAQLIKGIQSDVSRAVSTSKRGQEEVEKGVVLAGETGEAFRNIFAAVEQVTEGIQSITRNVNEEAEQSQRVSAAAEKIKTLILDVSSSTQDQSATTEEMVGVIEKMSELLRNVAAAMEEHAATNDEIARSVEKVSKVTASSQSGSEEISTAGMDLKKLADELMEMVDKFKLEQK